VLRCVDPAPGDELPEQAAASIATTQTSVSHNNDRAIESLVNIADGERVQVQQRRAQSNACACEQAWRHPGNAMPLGSRY